MVPGSTPTAATFVTPTVTGPVRKHCVSNKDVKHSLNRLYLNKAEVAARMALTSTTSPSVASIRKIIYLSELSKLSAYDEELTITEAALTDRKRPPTHLE